MSNDRSREVREKSLLKRIGERVEERRKKIRLSQKELAVRAGISRASVSNIEGGRQHLSISTLLALADAMEVEPRDLLPFRRELTENELVIMRADDVPHSEKIEEAIAEFIPRPEKRG